MIDILTIELYFGETNIPLSAILIDQLKVLHPENMQSLFFIWIWIKLLEKPFNTESMWSTQDNDGFEFI